MANIIEKQEEVKYFRLAKWTGNKRFISVKVPSGNLEFCEDHPLGISYKRDIASLRLDSRFLEFNEYNEAVVKGSELAILKGLSEPPKEPVKKQMDEEIEEKIEKTTKKDKKKGFF